jgi:glycosyltransferase involved in cell wall biosynthesis
MLATRSWTTTIHARSERASIHARADRISCVPEPRQSLMQNYLVSSPENHSQSPILSVCVSLKNRSRVVHEGRDLALFPNCVRSLADAVAGIQRVGPVELVVADFRSDDWPLAEWLVEAAGGLQTYVVPVEGSVSRGRGLNVAAAHARCDRLFLCDADIMIEPKALRRALEVIDRGHVWLPICRYLDEEGGLEKWQEFGYGIAALNRSMFDAAGGVPEYYSWGGEDVLFFERLALHTVIVREQCGELNHQWHPGCLRFEHYKYPVKSDFKEHRAAAASTNSWGAPIKKFFGEHPDWQGELHLFENGRMSRPGIDAGDFEFEERRRLILKWDTWPPVTLHWNQTKHVYRDRTSLLTLRDVEWNGPSSPAQG